MHYLLGVINSSLIRFFWKKENADEKKTFPKIKKEALLSIPIPHSSKNQQAQIKALVKDALTLVQEITKANDPVQLEHLKSRFKYTQNKINKLVYQLFGLTESEIAIVETA